VRSHCATLAEATATALRTRLSRRTKYSGHEPDGDLNEEVEI
jgi:hypothetical protein